MLKHILEKRYTGWDDDRETIVYFRIHDENKTVVVWESLWFDCESDDIDDFKNEVLNACEKYGIKDMSEFDDFMEDFNMGEE